MLNLKDIKKEYIVGDEKITALNNININFRKNEFVSVLGPSGCGKTTLLNIIGGLDKYSAGDLIINNVSTKRYKDKEWDAYRNHSIGFIFQSYNLIPHQTVLSNVELALTLSGVSKKERHNRAKEVLNQVGLGDQMYKKPNQMSGGQMQRVAIARALINDPDILLADEPTGALDTETSTQIMALLNEIAKDRLIIMVTHNPELVDEYSTRIIKLLDGEIIDDSAPFDGNDTKITENEIEKKHEKIKKTSMSLFTAFSLSTNNLLTKKARTILTSFAGSIGIIGIALILSISSGIQEYINKVEEDTLSSYPIEIESENVDINTLLETLMGNNTEETEHDNDAVYTNTVMSQLINSMNTLEVKQNNLEDFKEFLDSSDEVAENASAIQYSYDFDFNVLTEDTDGEIIKSDLNELISAALEEEEDSDSDEDDVYSTAGLSSYYSSMISSFSDLEVWEELISGSDGEMVNDTIKEQYELVTGEWPESYDEVVLILDENNEVTDMALYALGLKSSEEMAEVLQAAMDEEELEELEESWTYEEIMEKTFMFVLSSDYYQYDSDTGLYYDISSTDAGLSYLYDNGIELKISGIIKPKEDTTSPMLSGSIGYTHELTEYVIEQLNNSEVVKAQLEDEETDILTGLPFATEENTNISDKQKASDIVEYFETLEDSEKAEIYTSIISTPSDEYVESVVEEQMDGMTRETIESMMSEAYAEEIGMDLEDMEEYIAGLSDDELFSYVEEMITQQVEEAYEESALEQLETMTVQQLAYALDEAVTDYTRDELASLYDEYMPATVSDTTLEDNLSLLGYVDMDVPDSISIYASSFETKENISQIIEDYNNSVSEDDQISYTDYVALLMSSISTVISGISYVLIAFVAISLVVSSIMIGIITYISVLERTKEIGILRSIGASKRDISRVFNAETIIVGFIAGIIGIIVTMLLTIPANILIEKYTDIADVAHLPLIAAVALILISIFLTFIAGLFPSRIAAKKDPVEALRVE